MSLCSGQNKSIFRQGISRCTNKQNEKKAQKVSDQHFTLRRVLDSRFALALDIIPRVVSKTIKTSVTNVALSFFVFFRVFCFPTPVSGLPTYTSLPALRLFFSLQYSHLYLYFRNHLLKKKNQSRRDFAFFYNNASSLSLYF